MPDQRIERSDAEPSVVSHLAAALKELAALAKETPADAFPRCDLVVERFEEGSVDRRHRASSISALHLAIRNRLPNGAVKAHVDAHLTSRLAGLQREGRFDGSSNRRVGFTQ